MAVPARVGRYEVELSLGQGAVGRSLLARDSFLGRQVVVKVIRDDLALSPEIAAPLDAQMRKAARDAATLSHAAIAAVHDAGDESGVGHFAVSEFVRGPTLRERMARGRVLKSESAPLARALGSALAYAHNEGVVHGNLKPENILLTGAGPKLVDFGVPARLPRPRIEEAPESEPILGQARAAGEPLDADPYAAPEVVAGGAPSARSDQYALAALLYDSLTGRAATPVGPLATNTTKVATNSISTAQPTGGAPGEFRGTARVDAVFDCALAREPRRRFPSCEVFTDALADALDSLQGTLPTPPTSQSSIVPRSTRQWQNAVAGVAVLIIFALLGLGGERRGTAGGLSFKSVARAFSASFALIRVPSVAPQIERQHGGSFSGNNTPSTSAGAAIPSAPPSATKASSAPLVPSSQSPP